LSKRLSDVRSILIFFDIVEFISETSKSLSLNNFTDMSGAVCAFSVTVAISKRLGIIGYSPMLLNFAGFINV